MRRAVLIGALLVSSLATVTPAQAQAPESPTGCFANRFNVEILADRVYFRPGDTINYSVDVRNVGAFGCDVSNVSLVFRYPGPDGTASGAPVTLTTATRYNIGTSTLSFGPFKHVATINDGVPGLIANVRSTQGVLMDPLRTPLDENKNISVVRTVPKLTIDKQGSIESGVAPQNVTYTFVVTNTSTTSVPMSKVRVNDDKCGSATYASGDDGDGKLSNGEKWTFTCAMLHQDAGVYTNTAYACAESDRDKRDVCSEPDTWTVTLTPPPGNPPASPPPSSPPAETAVKPANATQAPCTLSTPKGLTVRAGEVTTIKATVRAVDAGTSVKITLPGGKSVSAKTNSKGVALLKVRAPKTGTARITVAECSDVQRLTVRAARKTQSKRVPRVTG